MASDYPGAIDGLAATHADIEDAVLAVQNELGTNPSGSAATVAAAIAGKLDTTTATATYAPLPPTGGFVVYATEDQAVADANPSLVWLVLSPAEADTTAPTVPTGVVATPGSGQVSLSWTASTDAVGVTGYRVYRDGVLATSPTGTTSIVSSLTNGTSYAFTVSAVDAAGNESAQSTAVNATPTAAATAPGQVTGLTATPGDSQVALSWTAPSNGGSAITDYKVEFRTGAAAFAVFTDGTSTATTAAVTGLTNGTAYDFRVSAINAIGTGTVSATASATPVLGVTYSTTPVQIKSASISTFTSTQAVTLDAAPAVGNLLIYAVAIDKSGTVATAPPGFTTTFQQMSADSSILVAHKIADGSETGPIAATWTNSTPSAAATLMEWDVPTTLLDATVAYTAGSVATAVAGPLGPLAQAGLALAFLSIDTGAGASSVSNGYIILSRVGGGTTLEVAAKAVASGETTQTTFTLAAADQSQAGLAVFA